MPGPTNVIDAFTTPPLAALQQVLDTTGPYGPGMHTLTQFTTGGAFLLPSGTYDVGGTYGVLVRLNATIPAARGFALGYHDASIVDESYYWERWCQVAVQRQLPITGAWVTTDLFDVHRIQELHLWPMFIGGGSRLGLHVAPDSAIDLYYMCLL